MGYETLIGLALAAAGTGASMAASAQARDDMNRSMRASLRQQEQFKKQATPVFEDSLQQGGADASRRQMGAGRDQALDLYRELNALPLSSVTSPLPVDEGRLQGAVQQQQDAASNVQGLNWWALQQWLKNQQANNQLGVISNLAGSSASMAEPLAKLAGQRSANLAGIGSLLSTAGNLASIYGAIQPKGGTLGMPGGTEQLPNLETTPITPLGSQSVPLSSWARSIVSPRP